MRTSIITLLLFLLFIAGVSQNPKYEYPGRLTPAVKKEKLNDITSVGDITPDLWHRMILPYKDRVELNFRRSLDYPQGYYGYYHTNNYYRLIDYVSVEISALCFGEKITSKSPDGTLTSEQKNILNNADLGTDLHIKIRFTYKNPSGEHADSKIVEGNLAVTVIPATEAEFPGGNAQITKYLRENILNKITDVAASQRAQQAVVKFTVNEDGRITDPKLILSSTDLRTDLLIMEAIAKMPRWIPAKNAKGIRVKQEFSVPFGLSGC